MKKKLIALICIVTLFSCTKEDDNSTNNVVNPPNWIIGTWLSKETTIATPNGFRFTNDNITSVKVARDGSVGVVYAVNTDSFKKSVELGNIKVEENSTDNTYNFRAYTEGGTDAINLKFTKKSSKVILSKEFGDIEEELIKQ